MPRGRRDGADARDDAATVAVTAIEPAGPSPAAAVPAPPPPARRSPSSIPPMPMDEIGELARQVRVGLLRRPRTLPMKWMFDEVGAALFEAWTQVPECGIARAETRLLDRNAARIADALRPTTSVIELGPTIGRRKRKLLETLAARTPLAYTALELTGPLLRRSLRELEPIAGVTAHGLEGGVAQLGSVLARRTGGALVMWLGAGIGAYEPAAAEQALAGIRAQLIPGDALLLGTDLLKHESVLTRAYDDAAGVSAAFNRAYLARICRELGSDLDVRQFRHEARWNAAARRVELHLVATVQVHAAINAAGIVVHMEPGESIYTACAHKALPQEPGLLGERTGFVAASQWLDPTWPYAATLLIAR